MKPSGLVKAAAMNDAVVNLQKILAESLTPVALLIPVVLYAGWRVRRSWLLPAVVLCGTRSYPWRLKS